MLELHEYVTEDDPTKTELRNLLQCTMLTKLDKEIMKQSSVWDFIESNQNGAAFELDYNFEDGVPNK